MCRSTAASRGRSARRRRSGQVVGGRWPRSTARATFTSWAAALKTAASSTTVTTQHTHTASHSSPARFRLLIFPLPPRLAVRAQCGSRRFRGATRWMWRSVVRRGCRRAEWGCGVCPLPIAPSWRPTAVPCTATRVPTHATGQRRGASGTPLSAVVSEADSHEQQRWRSTRCSTHHPHALPAAGCPFPLVEYRCARLIAEAEKGTAWCVWMCESACVYDQQAQQPLRGVRCEP